MESMVDREHEPISTPVSLPTVSYLIYLILPCRDSKLLDIIWFQVWFLVADCFLLFSSTPGRDEICKSRLFTSAKDELEALSPHLIGISSRHSL